MLLSLRIENFALIDSLELSFGQGLNVLTGETGAGKSIILDALDAALGGRLTSRVVRTGADRALVEATFHLTDDLGQWLTTQDIEPLEDGILVCSREMSNQGSFRNRSRVNGVTVNKAQMEELRDRLVELTAQGQTVQLGQANVQRDWLDGFGEGELLRQRDQVATAYMAYQKAAQALEKRRKSEAERSQQLDLFQFQAKELREANLSDPQELEQLTLEHQRLSHSVELQRQSYQVYQLLYQNDAEGYACSDLLGDAEAVLLDMQQYDPELQPILDLVSDALAQIQEAGQQINTYGENLETDPERLEEVETRIRQLKQICRKYGPTLADAIAHYEQVQASLEELSDEGQPLEVLEERYQQRKTELEQACAQLSNLRQQAAHRLENQLLAELKPLAMEKVQFTVTLTPCTPTVAGADRVTYQFSPNPGEPLQPLTEIASGGEMSRFLLALKACLSQVDVAGTMVFDEIDVGVSGRVTQAIADKLHQLSRRHQVLCVTHQPIVAAKADHHYRVSKQVIGDGQREPTSNDTQAQDDVRTVVRVSPLNAEQRLEELAQLAGGKTDQEAIAFARSLLDRATQTNASEQNASEQNGSRQNASRQHASGQNDAGQDSAAIFSPVEPDLSNSDTPSKTTKSKQKTTSRTRKKRSQA